MCQSQSATEMEVGGVGKTYRLVAWVSRLRQSIPQLGLFTFFIIYTAAGAKIFQVLEHPAEVETQQMASSSLAEGRSKFIKTLLTLGTETLDDLEYQNRVSSLLLIYEGAVEAAVEAGVSPLSSNESNYQWNYIQSVFFASTVITTIGYGNMAPVTTWGRFFCILYGFIGIPVTLTVIADLGSLFANMVSSLSAKIGNVLMDCTIFKALMTKTVVFRNALQGGAGNQTSRGLIVLGAVVALLVYIAIGGGLFTLWEDWTFFEAFYFCFITMTTIGLGDLVPAETKFMLVCTLYILIGLALTSTIIELVRRQYAESWQQMKELSGRLGELSGPLADHLRRLGEQAGDLSMDVHLLKDLKDLRSAITLTKLEALSKDPKLRQDPRLAELLKAHLNEVGAGTDSGFLDSPETQPLQPRDRKKRVIQVVIYESSV